MKPERLSDNLFVRVRAALRQEVEADARAKDTTPSQVVREHLERIYGEAIERRAKDGAK